MAWLQAVLEQCLGEDPQGTEWGQRGNGEKPNSTEREKTLPAEGWSRQRKTDTNPGKLENKNSIPQHGERLPKTLAADKVAEWRQLRAGQNNTANHNGAVTGKAAANVLARVFEEESRASPSADRVKDVRTQTWAVLQNSATAGFDPCMTECLTLQELEEALKKMKQKKAPGPDGITNEMLKHLGPGAKRTLLRIYNQSWSTGTVPTIWKEAVIRPIPKKEKDKRDPSSYCPISLLSCVGKLLERIINKRLIWHLESNSVLTSTQTGYRQFRRPTGSLDAGHQRCLPREEEGSSSFLWPVKGLRQSLERGATAKASASRCTWQNVQVTQWLPLTRLCGCHTCVNIPGCGCQTPVNVPGCGCQTCVNIPGSMAVRPV